MLTKRGRRGIEGALVVSADGRREVVAMTGAGALAVGMAAQRPILVAESLALKLYVRGRSGRPFAPRTVSRQLAAGGSSIKLG
ncbi:unnamed protein product [marine sediment metagenome]|uniref:Uncharacterized protein n=1 Tax=marine sediment metagenome TaxID=412755 RepID=X1ESC1_9ZZZZ